VTHPFSILQEFNGLVNRWLKDPSSSYCLDDLPVVEEAREKPIRKHDVRCCWSDLVYQNLVPPSVHLFILDTLDGPAKGKKCELGNIVHICPFSWLDKVNSRMGRPRRNYGCILLISRIYTLHILVTIPLLFVRDRSLSSFSLPFRDTSRSGSFKAFNKVGKPRTSNRLASHFTASLEPRPMVDRVKAEPRVLPIRAKLSVRFCREYSSEVECWNFMKFGEFGCWNRGA
jgi:hypothetical protein